MMEALNRRPFGDENRALQVALELSMTNLNSTTYSMTTPAPPTGLFEENALKQKPRTNNITECVPVPSSEHVAEIVGRQGEQLVGVHVRFITEVFPNIIVIIEWSYVRYKNLILL